MLRVPLLCQYGGFRDLALGLHKPLTSTVVLIMLLAKDMLVYLSLPSDWFLWSQGSHKVLLTDNYSFTYLSQRHRDTGRDREIDK